MPYCDVCQMVTENPPFCHGGPVDLRQALTTMQNIRLNPDSSRQLAASIGVTAVQFNRALQRMGEAIRQAGINLTAPAPPTPAPPITGTRVHPKNVPLTQWHLVKESLQTIQVLSAATLAAWEDDGDAGVAQLILETCGQIQGHSDLIACILAPYAPEEAPTPQLTKWEHLLKDSLGDDLTVKEPANAG